MKICVFGLWHLGCVTAAFLGKLGFDVVGVDFDSARVQNLSLGKAPLHEPGLDDLLTAGLRAGKFHFTTDLAQALSGCDIIWITFDTPVNHKDEADVGSIRKRLLVMVKALPARISIIISSQVPAGFCRELERTFHRLEPSKDIAVCYSPENLRLGKALDVMAHPDRIVVGLCNPRDRSRFEPVFSALSVTIKWMSVESAEMTKHAINAFLATSVVFANEIATLCEAVGANAREVAEGLLSESRIGPKAYLSPGAPFAGGTLARDVLFLLKQGKRFHLKTPLIEGVQESNQHHKGWVQNKIERNLRPLKGCIVALLGLTYKPGTDTLRRSWAIELAQWLHRKGACVQAYDPQVASLPASLKKIIALKSDVPQALNQAGCAVVVTNHPDFRSLRPADLSGTKPPLVIDPNGVLFHSFAASSVPYICVGFKSQGETHVGR